MVRSYQQAAVIMALVELELCDVLAEQGLTSSELAARIGLHPRPLAAMLAAAAALGLVIVQPDGCFGNSELSAAFLVKTSPRYVGDFIKSQADQYLGYARLAEAVRQGSQVLPDLQNFDSGDGQPHAALRRLVLGLHSGGKQIVPMLLPHLAPYLAQAKNLLDVGCGAGTYALTIAEHYPQLQVTLLDQPPVLEIAAEIVAASPARSRATMFPADYRHDDFGSDTYDIIFFSQVLRTELPATVQNLLQRAAYALKKGGVVAIYDTWLAEDRAAPAENVFQNLTLALMYAEGGLFTSSDLLDWLKSAGFDAPHFVPIAAARPMLLTIAQVNKEE